MPAIKPARRSMRCRVCGRPPVLIGMTLPFGLTFPGASAGEYLLGVRRRRRPNEDHWSASHVRTLIDDGAPWPSGGKAMPAVGPELLGGLAELVLDLRSGKRRARVVCATP